jgi:hypothetical protein
MTSATATPNPFDTIPNEIIDLIVSFILGDDADDRYVGYDKDGSSCQIHQIIALMHVSRQFRIAMLKHKIWRDLNFQFEDLGPINNELHCNQFYPITLYGRPNDPPGEPTVCTNLPARISKLCHSLFHDPYFRESIEKKTEWRFASLEVLFQVLAHLPTFMESARTVILSLEGTELAIARLRECKSIDHLIVHALHEHSLNLDNIGRYLPWLKTLTVRLPDRWVGSWQYLEGLDDFTLDASFVSLEPEEYEHGLVLPTSSAKTLTRMTLKNCHIDDGSLKKFTSLKHLRTERSPIADFLAEALQDLPTSLSSLHTSIDIECPLWLQYEADNLGAADLETRLIMFDCPCFVHLTKICLGLYCESDVDDENFASYYIDNCMKAVTRMVSRLKLLEDVELWAGLDVERVHVLGQLQNLKRLDWVIPEDRYSKGTKSQDLTGDVVGIFRKMGKDVDSVTVEIVRWNMRDGPPLPIDLDE